MELPKLQLLGGFRLTAAAGEDIRLASRKAKALLAIVALAPGASVTRARLKALLWGDRGEDQASASLRQLLVSLRKELAPLAGEILRISDESVGLDRPKLVIDVERFTTAEMAGEAAQAVAHYGGTLLEGLDLGDEAFEAWLAGERRTLLARAIAMFERHAAELSGEARCVMAQRLVGLDPLREASHRALIAAHLANGEAAQARRQFETCKAMLARELGIEPAAETVALLGTASPATPSARPSIAVLPFANLGLDPEQQFLADGLTEDLITDLSRIPGVFVIAAHSIFKYRAVATEAAGIARDLGVRYLVKGSLQSGQGRLRLNAQLIDADSGTVLWAERFDRDLADVFALQDEVTRHVVEATNGRLGVSLIVQRPRPSNLESYNLCVRSRNLWSLSKALNREAHALLVRAVALDPNYAEAHWQLALAQFFAWAHHGESEEPNRRAAMISAIRAVDLDPKDSSGRWVLGYILLHDRRWDEASAQLEASLRLNPNDADAHSITADFKDLVGLPQEGVEFAVKALRLNPRPPPWYYWILGHAQVANGQYEDAVTTLRREETYRTGSRRILAAALALSGRVEEAHEEAKFFLADNPHFRVNKFIGNVAFKDQKLAQFWTDAYLRAGFPE